MEKKNVIFLSVIAVATLLTAVIGTTFAYFTANFTVSNQENANSSVKTKTLVGTTVTLGAPIKPTETVYPGFKAVQEITVTGTSGEVDGVVTLTVTPTIASEFGSDIEWTLYQSDDTAITCDAPVTNTTADAAGNKVYQSTNCTGITASTAKAIVTNTGSDAKTTSNITVKAGATHKFYLVAEYKNNESAAQNAAQGKSFSFTVSAKQVDNTTK